MLSLFLCQKKFNFQNSQFHINANRQKECSKIISQKWQKWLNWKTEFIDRMRFGLYVNACRIIELKWMRSVLQRQNRSRYRRRQATNEECCLCYDWLVRIGALHFIAVIKLKLHFLNKCIAYTFLMQLHNAPSKIHRNAQNVVFMQQHLANTISKLIIYIGIVDENNAHRCS